MNDAPSLGRCASTTFASAHTTIADDCDCRKPQARTPRRARRRQLDVDLAASFMVGDRWRDVEAGRRAGCQVVFVDRGYSGNSRMWSRMSCVPGLPEAAEWILRRETA